MSTYDEVPEDATEVYNKVKKEINESGLCEPSSPLLVSALITWISKDASRRILFKPYITQETPPVCGVSYVLEEKGKHSTPVWLSGQQMKAKSIVKTFREWIE